MRIVNFYIALLNLRRAFQITCILIKHLFIEMRDHWQWYFSRKRPGVRHRVYSTPQRLRQTIEELGPTYVKFGQIMADRPDMVSEKFRMELKKLQSKAEPFDNETAFALIEKELGQPISSVFERFDPVPLAAASVGQVYRAELKNGARVVVKIQRPFIEHKMKLDIYLMKYLAKKTAKAYPEMAAINIVGLVDEFSENILQELDYRLEANNIKVFESMFSGEPTVKIPKVYKKYTTRRLIVTEYIDGVTPDSRQTLKSHGFDCDLVVTHGARALFTMVLQNGFFHADPHPGNLFVLEDNVVAFIDFGMVGVLRPKDINFLADFTVGFSKKDSLIITKSLLELCSQQFFVYEEELSFDIHRMLMQNFTSSVVDMQNFSRVMQRSVEILMKYDLQIPTGIFMLIKTLGTLEKFAQEIAPELDLARIVLPYARECIQSRYAPRRIAHELYETAVNYTLLLRNLPNQVGEILYKLKEGKIKHDIKLNDEHIFTITIRRMTLRIAYVLLLIGLFIGASILIVWDNSQRFGYFILYLSSILILLLLVRWILFGRK